MGKVVAKELCKGLIREGKREGKGNASGVLLCEEEKSKNNALRGRNGKIQLDPGISFFLKARENRGRPSHGWILTDHCGNTNESSAGMKQG